MEPMELHPSKAVAAAGSAPPQLPPLPDWKGFAAHLRALDQRVGMGADSPDTATGPHMRVEIWLEHAVTGRVVTLPAALRHSLRPGPPRRARLELLIPATERGRTAVEGLQRTWAGQRAADIAPVWEGMCVEVRGRGTLEAAAGVLATWARAFPEAVTRVGEAGVA